MKGNPHIYKIIRIHLSGNPTPEESCVLRNWLNESDDNTLLYREMRKAWQEKSAEPQLVNTDELAEKIWKRALGSASKANFYHEIAWQYWAKIAAVVLLFIGSATTLYFLTDFDSAENEVSLENDTIIKTNPGGQKSRFNLPDGSVVWLNAESTLRYKTSDFDSLRQVELSGEAFFEVAKDPAKKFMVFAKGLYTTALGTAFNVQAYPNTNVVEIALVEGNVKIDTEGMPAELLKPGSALAYDLQSRQTKKFKFDTELVLGWKEGRLIFRGDSMEEFISKTERWYGVKIEVSGSPSDIWSLSGYYENVPLDYLLEDVKFSSGFSYKIQKNKVNITFSKI